MSSILTVLCNHNFTVICCCFFYLSPLQHCTSANVFRTMCFFFLLDRSTQEILAQHASAAAQYNSTLHKLTQINTTVNYLLDVLEKTRHVGICGHSHFVFVISFWLKLATLNCVCILQVLNCISFFISLSQTVLVPFPYILHYFFVQDLLFLLEDGGSISSYIFISFYHTVYHHIPEDNILRIVCLMLQHLHMAAVS